jgi:hypothetical protein
MKKAKLIINILFELAGYGFLFAVDWKVALGVFFIHWQINMDCKNK